MVIRLNCLDNLHLLPDVKFDVLSLIKKMKILIVCIDYINI